MRACSLIGLAAIASCAAPAAAHAFLQHADPGAGRRLTMAPTRVVLSFSEQLEPTLSGAAITDGSGRSVAAGAVAIRGKAMVAPVRPLRPGSYLVTWHVMSIDRHRTEGAYSFTVKP